MYSNDKTQIKQGLTNYVGALLKACRTGDKTSRAVKQDVAATLIEEAMLLSADENNVYDPYVLKPLIRATAFLLSQRANELDKLDLPQSKEISSNYIRTATKLKEIVDQIK